MSRPPVTFVLGIETSCDETSAAVVRNGTDILSSVVLSQDKLHRPFNGVVPEIACRAHVEEINWIVEKALKDAGKRIDAVAVTVGPGLVGALLVGRMTAEAIGWARGIPVVGVNHLEGHLFSSLLDHKELAPPFMGLVVSGGHTDLVLVKGFGRYKVLGRTRDDSAGESFDKVANLLKLGYPGGPRIDKLAGGGNPAAVAFPRPYLKGTWDFSFSGLKTAVLYYLQKNKGGRNPGRAIPKLSSRSVRDVCASFQSAVVDVLVEKSILAAREFKLKKIAVGGGVSANSALRAQLTARARTFGIKVYFPSPALSTDNAAMIASAGAYKLRAHAPSSLSVDPSLPVLNWA